jgi:hypothetical protein
VADTDYDAQFKLFCLDLFSEIVKTVGWKKADDESHVQVSMLKKTFYHRNLFILAIS